MTTSITTQDSLQDFKNNIHTITSEKLCEIVATFRYLSMLKEEALIAMETLAARRIAGDSFNFEHRIQEILSELPDYKIDLKKTIAGPGLQDILSKIDLSGILK